MKEEALKLADELEAITGYSIEKESQHNSIQEASAMIRRLVEELDATEKAYKWTEIARNAPTKPLSDEEIYNCMNEILPTIMNNISNNDLVNFARAIEERHGIK